ncbi:AT-rich interactive domain-containing protein 6 isoform X2 [Mercurialis annua]|uniref:AT-rich interactive domain-containing protein 6 isoform X2 n=1 Tax=Mercurialis annua TaxID=3986 RepID=UPI00215DF453|nr:AT-rich interactive domain-containing protein 6 isoform X2 [Mercurialis annua]
MEDTEVPSQDWALAADVPVVDATGVVDDVAGVMDDVLPDQLEDNQKNPSENGKTSVPAPEDDNHNNTHTLASDVHMSDIEFLPDEKATATTTIAADTNMMNDENTIATTTTAADANVNDEKTTATTTIAADANVNDATSIDVAESINDGNGAAQVLIQPDALAVIPITQRKPSASRTRHESGTKSKGVWTDFEMGEADDSGTPEDRAEFMRDLEAFCKEHHHEYKPPKFYGEPLNCLKLWRSVIRLGGYEVVTASKLWRQVGESFHPPKTCTTVSWTFRIFYEKTLLEYEKHKSQIGELQLPNSPLHQPASVEKEVSGYQAPGSGRARRDSAARAMQGWHAQRLLGHGEVSEPIIKDRNVSSAPRREKPLKSIGLLKHKSNLDISERHGNMETDKELDLEVIDVGPPADWVKVNVRESNDCFEVYALVPGLLREEVRVQSDPAGRLVITGQPEQLDNPWGITPFKKVISLPSRIDPLQTSAVVSLHGRLYVRVPIERGSA